jgi:hypothetical protein
MRNKPAQADLKSADYYIARLRQHGQLTISAGAAPSKGVRVLLCGKKGTHECLSANLVMALDEVLMLARGKVAQ